MFPRGKFNVFIIKRNNNHTKFQLDDDALHGVGEDQKSDLIETISKHNSVSGVVFIKSRFIFIYVKEERKIHIINHRTKGIII